MRGIRVVYTGKLAVAVKRATPSRALDEGQHIAEEVLHAEARFGELLDLSLRDDKSRHSPEKKLPEGVSRDMSSNCQRLAKYPEIIERVAARAREEDRLVTRKEVLREIVMTDRPRPGEAPPLPIWSRCRPVPFERAAPHE